MRVSIRIAKGVWISGNTRSRRRRRTSTQARSTTQHWTHPYCTTQHRSEQAALKCANSPAVRARRAAAELQARRNAELVEQRAIEKAAAIQQRRAAAELQVRRTAEMAEQRAIEKAAAKKARQERKSLKAGRWHLGRSSTSVPPLRSSTPSRELPGPAGEQNMPRISIPPPPPTL
jgi:hypothetical protein